MIAGVRKASEQVHGCRNNRFSTDSRCVAEIWMNARTSSSPVPFQTWALGPHQVPDSNCDGVRSRSSTELSSSLGRSGWATLTR